MANLEKNHIGEVEARALADRVSAGDAAALNELVERSQPLAVDVHRRISRNHGIDLMTAFRDMKANPAPGWQKLAADGLPADWRALRHILQIKVVKEYAGRTWERAFSGWFVDRYRFDLLDEIFKASEHRPGGIVGTEESLTLANAHMFAGSGIGDSDTFEEAQESEDDEATGSIYSRLTGNGVLRYDGSIDDTMLDFFPTGRHMRGPDESAEDIDRAESLREAIGELRDDRQQALIRYLIDSGYDWETPEGTPGLLTAFADKHGVTRRTVSNWLTDARQRLGVVLQGATARKWTARRHRLLSGARAWDHGSREDLRIAEHRPGAPITDPSDADIKKWRAHRAVNAFRVALEMHPYCRVRRYLPQPIREPAHGELKESGPWHVWTVEAVQAAYPDGKAPAPRTERDGTIEPDEPDTEIPADDHSAIDRPLAFSA